MRRELEALIKLQKQHIHRICSSRLSPKVKHTITRSDSIGENCGMTYGGGEAESWKVGAGRDFRDQGPPATLDRKRN